MRNSHMAPNLLPIVEGVSCSTSHIYIYGHNFFVPWCIDFLINNYYFRFSVLGKCRFEQPQHKPMGFLHTLLDYYQF